MLGHHNRDRRQLCHLMAPRTPRRHLLRLGELVPAAATGLRVVVDDLRDLIVGQQLAPRPLVTGLAAGLAPATLGQQLLRLRPGLRASLLTRLGRIRRRRLRPGTRTLPRLLLKPRQPLVQKPDLALIPDSQLKQELDARLPPRVIDRLRLCSIHVAKFAPTRSVPSDLQTVNLC